MRALGLTLVLLLAGCAQPEVDEDEAPAPWVVEGLLLDEAIRPVAGARVFVHQTPWNTTTDEAGHWSLSFPPGPNGTFVLQLEAEGFAPLVQVVEFQAEGERKQVRHELMRVATDAPRVEVLSQEGLITCSGFVAAGHSHGGGDPEPEDSVECGATEDHHVWDLTLPAGLVGLVIEVEWEAHTELAENLLVMVHRLEGNETPDEALAFNEGPSILRAQVPRLALEDGGDIRIDVRIGGGPDQEDVAAGLAFQQDFRVYASLFWGESPPVHYSVAD